eukprot:15350950-Alexandrium_andersonii.AAC.1
MIFAGASAGAGASALLRRARRSQLAARAGRGLVCQPRPQLQRATGRRQSRCHQACFARRIARRAADL